MAKVTSPLFSQSAGGSLGRAIIYGKTPGRMIAKRWHQPSGTPRPAQVARRNAYAAASDAWNLLTTPEKAAWTLTGAALKITGFNAFISDALITNPPATNTHWDGSATTWDGGLTTWFG